ncbi:hypothetical protein J2X46_001230 [Nocardioides sp. BE266]|uniref:hypothetical protein n=1 Tax=Nocardioides sp. BE266 TaxID=2817725 RepID=UPI002859BD38|nr:hypothetical protein [Nocardioides sp. BE266]MDR7252254.1 hypothetical protein [Nocardioides sp. BE266]
MLTLFSGRHLMHVRRALALAVAVPLLLAGCTDEAEPTPKMPDPTSSSSSPSPSELETPEAESAEDFVRRWVDVDRDMQNSGDVGAYTSISSKCRTCMSVAERVEGIFGAGGFVKTNGLTILRIVDQSGAEGRKVFDVRVRSSPTVFKESANAKEQRLPGGTVTYRMRLTSRAPWQLVQLTQLAS